MRHEDAFGADAAQHWADVLFMFGYGAMLRTICTCAGVGALEVSVDG